MAGLNYDVVLLIEMIEKNPCLWDKRNENYKNKISRDGAWEEIIKFLDVEYDGKTKQQKKETGDKIMAKWANIRDAFMRSLKTKSGQASKRNYLFHEHLQFLLTIQESSSTQSSTIADGFNESLISVDTIEENSNETDVIEQNDTVPAASKRKSSRSKRELNEIEREIMSELKRPRVEKPQNTFFTSFEPYVEDMDEGERLALHASILNSIISIKSKRNQNVLVEVLEPLHE